MPKPAKKQWKCSRCGHEWDSRDGQKPRACASCVSHYWDTPKRLFKKESPEVPTAQEARGMMPPPRLR